MDNIALIVVDVQTALVKAHPYNEEKVIENMRKLIMAARNAGKEVIYVRHDDGKGSDLENGTEGWQIYDEIGPLNNEYIVEKEYNSAFHKTDLREYLRSRSVDTIILMGMQTEYCIDATLKSAFDYEYKIIIPEETNTTFDNEYLKGDKLYNFYNYKIWNKRFAEVLPINKVLEILEGVI